MTAGRDVTMIVLGVVIGGIFTYVLRGSLGNALKNIGGAQAYRGLNMIPYGSVNPLQRMRLATWGQGFRPAFTNNTLPIFFGPSADFPRGGGRARLFM